MADEDDDRHYWTWRIGNLNHQILQLRELITELREENKRLASKHPRPAPVVEQKKTRLRVPKQKNTMVLLPPGPAVPEYDPEDIASMMAAYVELRKRLKTHLEG